MPAEDDFKIVSSMADWLGFDGETRDQFVAGAMKSKGHKPVMNWADNDEGGPKKSEDNPFDKLFAKPDNDESGGGNHREKKSGGWQYE